jgi:hypothetical protein
MQAFTFIALVNVLGAVCAVESGRTVAGVGTGHRVRVAPSTRVAGIARTRVLKVAQQTSFSYA